MWSFSSLFPSPGLSELNGSFSFTKAQGQVLLHKLPIQLTVCKMLHWQAEGRTAILASVIPNLSNCQTFHSGACGHCLPLNAKL